MGKETKNELIVTKTSTNEIVLYQPDETVQLEVRLQDETVWLNQQQIAVLFGTQRQAITKHLKNIFESGELDREATCSILELVQKEGNRMVRRNVEIYNLDIIISIGYRVNTKRGIQFRQWANRILKDYMLRGYVVNQRLISMEERIDRQLLHHTEQIRGLQEKVDFFVRTSLPPQQGIFFDGQIFDAYTFINDRIREATTRIILIDNYIDDSVLTILSKRGEGVTAKIYTKKLSTQLQLDIQKHNAQYSPIEILEFDRSHDRFLCIDETVYHLGASIKDLGKRWFAFNRMEMSSSELLQRI